TNIVRHGLGATRCTVALDEQRESGGRYLVLEVTDNGRGPEHPAGTLVDGPGGNGPGGNGLTGLRERLALVGGRLETGPGPRGKGFRVRAVVPLRTPADVPDQVRGHDPTGTVQL